MSGGLPFSPSEIGELLGPCGAVTGDGLLDRLSVYLELLLRWNAKTNLTAVRDPREIVVRHFGESLFAARYVQDRGTLLDYGSGAGFPGLPIALVRPGVVVTLAESQNKKASFLREAVRVLELSTQVWPARVEDMSAEVRFDCVTLRAVDKMIPSTILASRRALSRVLVLTATGGEMSAAALEGFVKEPLIPMPTGDRRVLAVFRRC